jgi:hypothetical protein
VQIVPSVTKLTSVTRPKLRIRDKIGGLIGLIMVCVASFNLLTLYLKLNIFGLDSAVVPIWVSIPVLIAGLFLLNIR